MRSLSYLLLIVACLFPQRPPTRKLFPIPEDMEYEFRGVKLADTEAKLLMKAFEADFANEDGCDDNKLVSERAGMAGISLGKLGNGVVVKRNDVCLCGTGGCPLYAYVREKEGWRAVAKSFGWAFGIVPSKIEIPDMVFASSGGGGLMSLVLQRYDGRQFVEHACETLTAKEGFPKSPDDWFDPEKVAVSACKNLAPSSPGARH